MHLLAQAETVTIAHPMNFAAGWILIAVSFLVGAVVGLAFHHEEFLGGYASFRRRLLRLGHIALAALGMLNLIYGLSPVPSLSHPLGAVPGWCLLAGAMAMPAVCFLAAWKQVFRHLFFIPVTLLFAAVLLMIYFTVLL